MRSGELNTRHVHVEAREYRQRLRDAGHAFEERVTTATAGDDEPVDAVS